jgi:hypothetical protein
MVYSLSFHRNCFRINPEHARDFYVNYWMDSRDLAVQYTITSHPTRARHSLAGRAGVHFQSQTFPRVRVHQTQHPDRSSAVHRIVHEIQRPLLVRRGPDSQWLSHAGAGFPLFPPGRQPRLPIHSMHAVVVHMFSRAGQQYLQPPIPEARLLPRQLHPPRSQQFIRAPRLVAVTRCRYRQQTARPPLAEGILRAHLLDSRLQGYPANRQTSQDQVGKE